MPDIATGSGLRRALGVRLGRFRMYAPRPLPVPAIPLAATDTSLRFAIVTPVRNQVRTIRRAMASVLDQGYANVDYVVKDAASTDGTLAAAGGVEDARLRVVSAPDAGLAAGLNAGFALATGELMGYLNGDDLLLPGALSTIASYFAAHPDVDVVYGHRIVIDEDDQDIGRWVLPPHSNAVLGWDDYLPQETVFWRRRVWEAAGARFDETLQFAVDWDLWLRFRACGARFVRLPRYLGAFRLHPAQKTQTELAGIGGREMDALRARYMGRVPGNMARGLATAPYLLSHVALSTADRVFRFYR